MAKKSPKREKGGDGNGPAPGTAKPAAPPARGGGRPKADARLREVSMLVEEADYLLHLYRWIVLAGEVPTAQDWLKTEEWPHPDVVVDVFGSWEKFLGPAQGPDPPLLPRPRDAY